jgi:hypothetical protein
MGCWTPRIAAAALACCTACAGRASAQEMEPRAYSPSPSGVTFAVLGYANSSGGILTDPSLPVDDVEGEIDSAIFGAGRTFGLFGRGANFAVAVPYLWGDFRGTLEGEPASASRSGLGDTRLRLSVNLFGNPVMTPAEFARRTPDTIVGASLIVSAPTGQYHGDRLVNPGTNRWAIKPEIGVAHPIGRWQLESYGGVWLFEDNDNYFGSRTREQDPLWNIQAHVSYTFRPRLWVAFDATFYDGGRTTTGGVELDNRQSNTRAGVTLSLPVGRDQSVKLSWNRGATTRIGSDFTTWGIAWQYSHVPHPR